MTDAKSPGAVLFEAPAGRPATKVSMPGVAAKLERRRIVERTGAAVPTPSRRARSSGASPHSPFTSSARLAERLAAEATLLRSEETEGCGGGLVPSTGRKIRTHLVAEAGRACGIAALALDYRLAPEHPFPAAVASGSHETRSWSKGDSNLYGAFPVK
jgi:hypothetical protein